MTHHVSFIDLKDFSGREPVPEVPTVPMMTVEEAEELAAAARRDGFTAGQRDGYEAGQASAVESLQEQVFALTRQIADQVDALTRAEDRLLNRLEEHAGRLILAAVRRLTEGLSDQQADAMAMAVAKRVIGQVRDAGALTISASPDSVDRVRRIFEDVSFSTGAAGQLVVEEDATLRPDQMRVAWRDGALTHDLAPIASSVDAILDDALERMSPQPGTEGEAS